MQKCVLRRSGEGDAILMQLQSRPCNPSHHNVVVEDLNFMRRWKWKLQARKRETREKSWICAPTTEFWHEYLYL